MPQATWVRAGLVASSAAWLLGALLFSRRSRWITLGMLWPVIALLPSHSFIAKADAISESGLYLCWAGPCIAFAMYLSNRVPRANHWTRVICLGALLMLAVLCGQRAAIWGDPLRLWHEATQSAPASARAWNNLGMAHLARDEYAAA
ncbi:MAG: hypothetical protein FJY37_11820 [Betaproteobacteria bacterium]|nr:hypothetical protein [Betaproteobacteria bacterium]